MTNSAQWGRVGEKGDISDGVGHHKRVLVEVGFSVGSDDWWWGVRSLATIYTYFKLVDYLIRQGNCY